MPQKTRNIAKCVPKSTKPKPSDGKKDGTMKAALTKKNHKRHASTSEVESEDHSQDSEPKARKKKHARQEAVSSDMEMVEEVDDDPVPKPPMELVGDIDDGEQAEQANNNEVSTNDYILT